MLWQTSTPGNNDRLQHNNRLLHWVSVTDSHIGYLLQTPTLGISYILPCQVSDTDSHVRYQLQTPMSGIGYRLPSQVSDSQVSVTDSHVGYQLQTPTSGISYRLPHQVSVTDSHIRYQLLTPKLGISYWLPHQVSITDSHIRYPLQTPTSGISYRLPHWVTDFCIRQHWQTPTSSNLTMTDLDISKTTTRLLHRVTTTDSDKGNGNRLLHPVTYFYVRQQQYLTNNDKSKTKKNCDAANTQVLIELCAAWCSLFQKLQRCQHEQKPVSTNASIMQASFVPLESGWCVCWNLRTCQ